MPLLSFKSAALKILQETRHPMSVSEIYKAATEQNLIKTSGETPEATMGAQIYTDIKKKPQSKLFKSITKLKLAHYKSAYLI